MGVSTLLAVGMIAGFMNGNVLTRIKIPSFIATLGHRRYSDEPRPPCLAFAGRCSGLLRMDCWTLSMARRLGIPNLLLLTFAVFLFFYVMLRFTTVGRNIYYIGSNIRMSWMSGIDIVGTRNFAFMLSGLAAAIAAIFSPAANSAAIRPWEESIFFNRLPRSSWVGPL